MKRKPLILVSLLVAANYLAAGVAAAGALMALVLLPAHPMARGDETAEPQRVAVPAAATATS
jgi:hypothetical protein